MTRFTRGSIALIVAALSVTAGCLPRQLVVWSPDGSRAVVMTQKETYVCDGDGKLAKTNLGVATAAAWMSDSRRVVLAVNQTAEKWADLVPALDEPTRRAIIAIADELDKKILQTPTGKKLPEEQAEAITKATFEGKENLMPAVLLYLCDHRAEAVKKYYGDEWEDLRKVSVTYSRLSVCRLDGMSLKPDCVLLNSLKGIQEVRLSPGGKRVAMVTPSDRAEQADALWAHTLWVAEIAAKATPVEVADIIGLFPDWSPDGKLVYLQAAGMKDDKPIGIGMLCSRGVVDADGNQPKPQQLAMTSFDPSQTVRCLPDGRIVFTSAELSIPAASHDTAQSRVFVYAPDEEPKVKPLLIDEAAEELAGMSILALGPDGKTVCVSNGSKVAVVSLANGKLTWVQRETKNAGMLPSWRKAGELCFLKAPGKDDGEDARDEVALWSNGKVRTISKDWPDEVMENLTFAPKKKPMLTTSMPATQPATRPGD